MAATNYTPISLYYSTTASAVPSSGNLVNGELGLNINDMKLYAKNSGGTVTLLASSAGASGSVTSVGFTGGLITVGTPTSTPAFTVAGTSGGIVYFSAASTWASSAALAANALVVGGGTGAAPATVTTGTGVVTALGVNTGSAGAFVVNGGALGTPSSGTLTNCTFPTLNQNTTGTAANVTGTVAANNGGTGVSNNAASTITISGAFGTTFTVSGTTAVTLPTSGTLATLAGTETFTNKTLTNPTITNYTETRYAATITSNAITLSLTNGTYQTITTMAGANAITLPAVASGKSLTVQVVYASTPTTLTFSTPSGALKYPASTTPTPTLTNGKYDFYSFISDGTNWYGVQTGANF